MRQRVVHTLAAAAVTGVTALAVVVPAGAGTRCGVQTTIDHGRVTFAVHHAEVATIRVRITGVDGGPVLFDSGAVPGDRVEWSADGQGAEPLRLEATAWNDGGDVVLAHASSVAPLDTIVAIDFATVPAGTGMASPSAPIVLDGELEVDLSGAVGFYELGGQGGCADVFHQLGGYTGFIQPDLSGEGGYLSVYRNPSAAGFVVDGNFAGSGNPYVAVYGSDGASLAINADATGDSEVMFAADAIASPERLDEAGVAFIDADGTVSVGTSVTSVAARTIFAPADGYVLAVGAVDLGIPHVAGTADNVAVGLSTVASVIPAEQDFQLNIGYGAATGTWRGTVTPTAVFPVSAGGTTVYLLAKVITGATSSVADRSLSLLYVPTAHGGVSDVESVEGPSGGNDAVAAPGGGFDGDALLEERLASEAFVAERRTAELADLRARLADLESRLADPPNGEPRRN